MEALYKAFVGRIKEEIGRDNYLLAIDKKEETKDKHIINTLDALGIYSYRKSFELLKTILTECKTDTIIFDYQPHQIKTEGGKVYFDSNDGVRVSVLPVFYPKSSGEMQLLLPYDTYSRIIIEAMLQQQSELASDIGLSFSFIDIVKDAITQNASDIHVVPKFSNYRVFFRIDDRLFEMSRYLMNLEQGKHIVKSIKIDSSQYTKGKFNIDETKVSQLARIEYENLGTDLRIELVPDGKSLEHVDVTARILHKRTVNIANSLEENLVNGCGILKEDVPIWQIAVKRKGGLVVVAGVTNSGKSTTIWNVISVIDQFKKIGTVEDPIEFISDRPNIVQHQIYEPQRESLHMGFTDFVRSFKRGDYDIVFIGEWRKTSGLTEAIIELVNAGQLILTTLHVRSAFEIYSAIAEVFGVDACISSRLITLPWSQLLLPGLCGNCKIKADIRFSRDDIQWSNISKSESSALLQFRCNGYTKREGGCAECMHTGYKGRVLIYDYFVPTPDLTTRIAKDRFSQNEIRELVIGEKIGKTKYMVFMEKLKMGLLDKSFLNEFYC